MNRSLSTSFFVLSQALTVEQYDNIILELDESYSLDATPTLSQLLVDFWGNRFEIVYRKLQEIVQMHLKVGRV